MNDWMRRILESKQAARKEAAALPFARKLELLERLRNRSLLIASSPLRRSSEKEQTRSTSGETGVGFDDRSH